jgi:hypothetical protein
MALLAAGPAPDELTPQYREELTRYAEQTLVASNNATNQRLAEPTQSIRGPQTQEFYRVAQALEAIDSKRRRDTTQLLSSSPPTVDRTPEQSAFVRSTPSLVAHSGRAIRLIPGPNAVAEQMDDLATDLHIMCRIFDKEVLLAHGQIREAQLRSWVGVYPFSSTNSPSVLKSGSSLTEALYVGDYGVVFLMKSAFPLVQPPATQAEQSGQEEGKTDAMWRQTWRELYAPEDARYKRGADETVAYDAEQVGRLRTALLATVKHAANIRHLGDTDWVTVVVKGPRSQTHAYSRARSRRGDLFAIGDEPAAVPSPETVLRLRVRKADVDAFASRSLDKDEFKQRADIVIY